MKKSKNNGLADISNGKECETKPKTFIGKIKNFFCLLGPGLVTGAADDDPSGIATYSIAGAQTGTSLLWMAWASWPLMASVQLMCARIGMVTGQGLAQNLRKKLPKWVVIIFCIGLLVANVINIAADLNGMADAMQLLTSAPSYLFVVLFGFGITIAMVQFRYSSIANVLKWLAVTLFAYVVTAFLVHPNWGEIFHQTIHISMGSNKEALSTIVAILGTTISPYLFFWQSAQEVELDKASGSRMHVMQNGATSQRLSDRKIDVTVGTLLSNTVMFFIILTAALTLNAHGITNISTSKEAAEALRPLAGHLAVLLYTVGLVTVGFLAIPTLAGSAAYAFAEIFGWRQGLDKKLKQARYFYAVVIGSTLGGMLLNFMHVNPVKALLWSAIVNGIVAPFILVGILMVARDAKLMNGQPSKKLHQAAVALATLLMFAAGIGMFVL